MERHPQWAIRRLLFAEKGTRSHVPAIEPGGLCCGTPRHPLRDGGTRTKTWSGDILARNHLYACRHERSPRSFGPWSVRTSWTCPPTPDYANRQELEKSIKSIDYDGHEGYPALPSNRNDAADFFSNGLADGARAMKQLRDAPQGLIRTPCISRSPQRPSFPLAGSRGGQLLPMSAFRPQSSTNWRGTVECPLRGPLMARRLWCRDELDEAFDELPRAPPVLVRRKTLWADMSV